MVAAVSRNLLIPWRMETPDGVRRVWLNSATGCTTPDQDTVPAYFDELAARALHQAALTPAGLLNVADVGALRRVNVSQ